MKKYILYKLLFLVTTAFYAQTIPAYYNGLDLTKTGNDLLLELYGRLESTHTGIPYTDSTTDTWDVLSQVDEDPSLDTNVLLIYGYNDIDGISKTDKTRNKSLTDTGGGDVGKWNREHVFAKSLANPRLVIEEPGPGTDVHNLKPADAEQNSDRSNKKFTDGSGNPGTISSNGGWYPGDEWKGDVARIVMYMYVRYHGDGSKISETQCLPINVGFGDGLAVDPNMIDLFLKWNVEDPVSDFEDQRNPVIEGIQGNRNPFIDNPYLSTLIWGGADAAEDRWELLNPSDTEPPTQPTNVVASAITDASLDLNWTASTDNIIIIDYLIYVNDIYYQTANTTSTSISNLSANTNYNITIKARDGSNNLSIASETLEVKTNAFTLPSNNFEIETISETCFSKENGIIKIIATENYNYTTVVNGVNYGFSTIKTIENLPSGIYEFCISVAEKNYEQCFTVVIEAGGNIAGKATIKANKAIVEVSKGTAPFKVLVNGNELFEINSTNFIVPVVHGDLVEVKSAIDCEGTITKQVDLFETVLAYPNPTKGLIDISLPIAEKEVVIELYNIHSQLISSKVYAVNYGKVQLNLEEQLTGIYIAKVMLAIPIAIKVVKN